LGGGWTEIGNDRILPQAKYIISVFQFDSPDKTKWGEYLGPMVAQQILGTINGVPSLGVVSLHQKQSKIDLTPENIDKYASQQGAIIAIWGEFYLENENVYLYSHLRIIPNEKIPFDYFGVYFGDSLTARLPTVQINFNPINLSRFSLDSMGSMYSRVIELHEKPSATSKIIDTLKVGNGYSLQEKQGEWTKLKIRNGKMGWVQMQTLQIHDGLNKLIGPVLFAQGLLQYVARNHIAAQKTFTKFLSTSNKSEENMTIALAHLLRGASKLHYSRSEYDSTIFNDFYVASSLISNSAPANYLATYYNYWSQMGDTVTMLSKLVESKLVSAINYDEDSLAVCNLLYLYYIHRNAYWENQNIVDMYTKKILFIENYQKQLEMH
jgi:hypothetical protein